MARRDNEWRVLKAVNDSNVPVGAVSLSGEMGIPSANIGRTLSQLEKRGLVAKVQNKGRTITELGKRYLDEQERKNTKISIANELIDSAAADDGKSLLEILRVRQLLEGCAVRLCAESATPGMIQELEDLQFEYIYELRHGRTGSEQDLRLHLKIAECSGNHTIARILKLLLTDNNAYAAFTKAAVSHNRLRQNEHEAILEAIRQRDGERAAREMEGHLSRVIKNVEDAFRTLEN